MERPCRLGLSLVTHGEIVNLETAILNTAAIEVGKVVYVKTTEEPVFVMAIDNTIALVRRPLQSDRGVTHVIETFSLQELETKEDKTLSDAKFLKFQLEVRDRTAKERQQASQVNSGGAAAESAEPEGYLN